MKKVEAFIRHEAFEPIRDRLASLGLPSMSVSEVKGSGRQAGAPDNYRGRRAGIFLRPKIKLEIVLDDKDVDKAVDAILELAQTGHPGDGKIFVIGVEESIRVRTGERGDVVLEAHPEDA
jgi:nitrogen regulatory protein PII